MAVGVALCAVLVFLFTAIFILAIGMKNRNIAKDAKAEERFNTLAEQNNETQRMFRVDVKKIMDGLKQIVNK